MGKIQTTTQEGGLISATAITCLRVLPTLQQKFKAHGFYICHGPFELHKCDRRTIAFLKGCVLERLNLLGLPALRSLYHLKLHALALLQAAESACLNSRKVYEYILAILTADKAVAFCVIEPLYCSLFHFWLLPFDCFITLEGSRWYLAGTC